MGKPKREVAHKDERAASEKTDKIYFEWNSVTEDVAVGRNADCDMLRETPDAWPGELSKGNFMNLSELGDRDEKGENVQRREHWQKLPIKEILGDSS